MGIYRGNLWLIQNAFIQEHMEQYLEQLFPTDFLLADVLNAKGKKGFRQENNPENIISLQCDFMRKEREKANLEDFLKWFSSDSEGMKKPEDRSTSQREEPLTPTFYSIRKAYCKFNGMRFVIKEQLSKEENPADNRYQVELENGLRIIAFEDELNGFVRKHEKDPVVLPVSWEMYSEVTINKPSVQEAMDFFKKNTDDIDLPENGEYVDASYRLSCDDPRLVASLYNHSFRNLEREKQAPAWPVLAVYASEMELNLCSERDKEVAEQVCWEAINSTGNTAGRTALHDCARLWMKNTIPIKTFWIMVRQNLHLYHTDGGK